MDIDTSAASLLPWRRVPSLREAVLGPSYFYHRDIIARSKTWSAGEIEAFQEQRYQRLIDRYGDQIRQRSDYSLDLRMYTRWDAPFLTRYVRTGGTSGQPLRFKADIYARRQKERAYLFDIWSAVGYAPHDLRVVYRGDIHRKMLHFDVLENAWVISPNATTEGRLDALATWIRRLPPFFLHVYPSSLYTLIDLLGEDVFRTLPVRGVLAGSEIFPLGERERFERDFGVRVAHWYGHSEYAALAYSCRECLGFHFYPTYGHVELLPSPTDGLSRIVATSFNRVGTQFVRYDTGDVANAANLQACSSVFPRVGHIVGRAQETFVDRAGRRRALGAYVFGIHGPFWDQVRDLQFVQEQAGSMRVVLVTSRAFDTGLIEQTLQRRIPMVELEFEYVSAIQRAENGKRKYFVDALAKQGE
jgi:phenylacetate-CoA ligase